jgi:hypothetical protein
MLTFFVVLSMLFFTKRKYSLSAFFLAIATLTKINAIGFFPLWFLILFRKDKRKSMEFFAVSVASLLILSIPWIFMNPVTYVYQQIWPGGTGNTQFSIEPQWILWSTTPFHAFLYWGWDSLAFIYFRLNSWYVPFILFNLICYLTVLLIGSHLTDTRSAFYTFNAMFVVGFHIFLSRGNYKYYDSFFIPFIVVAIAERCQNVSKRKRLDIPITANSKFTIIFDLGFVLFCILIGWIVFLNVWIIIKIKWLHIFYTFLMFLTMILLFDVPMHTALTTKNNYSELARHLFQKKNQKIKTEEKIG